MKIILPKSLSLTNINSIITDFRDKEDKEVFFDLTELEYVDSGSANYVALLPFYFRSFDKKVKILINSKQKSYDFIKKIGIIEDFEDNFHVEDINLAEKKPDNSLEGLKEKYQKRIFDTLSSDPFFRTFLANNDKDKQILRKLSIEYKHVLSSSQSNEYKITRCLTELIDNIFQHSEQTLGAISIHHISQNKVPFLFVTVTDMGIGFKKSLLKSKKFKDSYDLPDEEFIKSALEIQVSSTDSKARGFGLPTVAKYSDRLSITSGFGNVTLFNDNQNNLPKKRKIDEPLIGANIISILKLDEESIIVKK